MGNHDLAEFGVGGGYVFTDRRIDGEPVILGGYFDFAGGFIHDGLVDTAVSKGQLVGTEPERTPEKLIAKADTEERGALAQYTLQEFNLFVSSRRVAGTIGEK